MVSSLPSQCSFEWAGSVLSRQVRIECQSSHGKQPLFKNGNRPFKISISRNVSIPEPINHAQKAEIVQKIIQN